jgi:putative cardiolipin synthase
MMTINSALVDSICTGSRAALCSGQPSHGVGRGSAVFRSCCFLLLTLVLLAGCATVPKDYPRTESTAFQDYLETGVGQLFEETAAQHPGESGFALIRYGRPAFTARIALADLAEKTLDAQYYIWEADVTGWVLAERLMRAADRGVRVRLLVDDINLAGRDDNVAAMDAHPNIEIRVFNPFANRSARVFDFLTDLGRVNHRMHNKIMVMDNAVAIVGGRNIGNDYFGVDTDANYRDLDIAAAGPVVRETSNVFDRFWNGPWAVPIAALVDRLYTEADLRKMREWLRKWLSEHDYPYPLDQDVADLRSALSSIRDTLIWAPGQIVWDDPAAIEQGIHEGTMVKALFRKIRTLQEELLIESAYFVVRDRAVEVTKQLTGRGVRVRILTNSLASNDVIAAHAGHAKRRDELIAAGAEVYEYRPDSRIGKTRAWRGESKAALHTKAIVFDRESVFIGSFNLDPRSSDINTEAGLYVESPELAEQLVAYMDEGVRPENSYRVLLDEDGDLYWVTVVDGAEVRYDKDPESTFWQRFEAGFIMILPIEHQL